jgi:hypothetical protein
MMILFSSFEPAIWLAVASLVGTAFTTVAALWLSVRRPRSRPATIEINTSDGQRIAIAVDPDASSAEIGQKVSKAIEDSHANVATHAAATA